ncbi:MAG: efflux RND transporter periplasmic adaptor subunit [Verrucomicrobia bacterium]|nr:efflux RND transporter periplasmic adaptor subunit [Verrucomicrobiota bacterium]
MKKIFVLPLLFSAALLLAGCGHSQAESTAGSARAPDPAAVYKAGHGLKLSPFAREFVGLATTEFSGRLPAAALLRTVQGDFVFVANGEWFLRTPVTVSAVDGAAFTVTNGLYEGDTVVTRGMRALWLAELHNLRAGQACARGG